jgi:opacity protein-like surface antigen
MPYVTLKVSLKIKHFVRQSLFFALVLLGIGFPVTQARSEILPDIEAHQFKIMPLEKSRTGRVYRFKVDAEQLPKSGAILLIIENEKPTMAFRVLNTDFDHSEFVAKRVRRYDTTGELKVNEKYQTVEKIGDLVSPPPPETGTYDPNAKPLLDGNPGKDLVNPNATPAPPPSLDPFPGTSSTAPSTGTGQSAQPGTSPKKSMDVDQYDDDLDSSTSPTNLKGDAIDSGTKKEDPDAKMPSGEDADLSDLGSDLEVKETKITDPLNHAIGFAVGGYKNVSNMIVSTDSAGGFSAYYSSVANRNLFFKKKGVQDSLSLEYGFEYYNFNNVNGHNDDYTLFPLYLNFRYDVHLSQAFAPFVYIGAQYNWVASTKNVDTVKSKIDEASYNNLHGFGLNVGVGVFYNIGPQWYLRGDLGLDRFSVGLSVKW